jgi:hypothetical protein
VKTFITGISGIWRKNIEMIPYREMTQLLKICSEIHETTLTEHQWVRIKSGPYQNDLGIVELVEGSSQRALVKLIPRIQYETTPDGDLKMHLAIKNSHKNKDDGTVAQNVP